MPVEVDVRDMKWRVLQAARHGWSRPRPGAAGDVGDCVDGWLDARSPTFDPDFKAELEAVNPRWLDGRDQDHAGSLHWSVFYEEAALPKPPLAERVGRIFGM